jgi:hypothetical protein
MSAYDPKRTWRSRARPVQLIFIKKYFVGARDVLFGAIVEALLTLCARSLHLAI